MVEKRLIFLVFFFYLSLISGQVIIVRDPITGKRIQFSQVTTWYDNTPLSRQKADGLIYIVKHGKYYKRVTDGGSYDVKIFWSIGEW